MLLQGPQINKKAYLLALLGVIVNIEDTDQDLRPNIIMLIGFAARLNHHRPDIYARVFAGSSLFGLLIILQYHSVMQ